MRRRLTGPLLLSMLAGAKMAGVQQTPNIRNLPLQRLINETNVVQARLTPGTPLFLQRNGILSGGEIQPYATKEEWTVQQKALTDLMNQYNSMSVAPQEVFDGVIQSQIHTLPEFDVLAHGILTKNMDTFIVPPKTVVIFFNLPGTSTAVSFGNSILSADTKSQLKAGSATARKSHPSHSTDHAYAVMNVNGDEIPDVSLDFNDDYNIASRVGGNMGLREASSNTRKYIPLAKKQTTLANVIRTQGPGVYYVISCRPVRNLRQPSQLDRALKLAATTQRQRQRQQVYSGTNFDVYKNAHTKLAEAFADIKKLLPLSFGSLNTFVLNNSNNLDMYLSGRLHKSDGSKFDRERTKVIALVLGFLVRATAARKLADGAGLICRGGSFSEVLLLVFSVLLASDNPSMTNTLLSGFKLYASSTAIELMSHGLTMGNIRRARQKMPAKLSTIVKYVSSLSGMQLLRKYGFNTSDPVQLRRLYAYHSRRFPGNKTKQAEINKAFAMAPARWSRQLPIQLANALHGRSKKPLPTPPLPAKETKKLLRRWGMHTAHTVDNVDAAYARELAKYSLWNRLRGKVDPSLAQARTRAKARLQKLGRA